MRATKLPSGNYRVRVYIGEKAGKKQFISVTAKSERDAMKRAYSIQAGLPASDSFEIALDDYILAKEAVLSPSTIIGYKVIQKRLKNDFKRFCAMPIGTITASSVQEVINGIVKAGGSPKTVRNFSGLISATLKSNGVSIGQITLPKKYPGNMSIPTREHIKRILAEVRGGDIEIPVLLSSFAGLRRGEVCALQWSDFDFKKNTITVNKDIVLGPDGEWHTKPPKTKASVRTVQFPKKHMKRIQEIGELPTLSPNALSDRFRRLMKRMGYDYHFHTLRHFCASYMHSLGIPDAYIMQRCGWENDTILKNIYRHTLADQEKTFVRRTNKAFESF